jgi:hypothetical protein
VLSEILSLIVFMTIDSIESLSSYVLPPPPPPSLPSSLLFVLEINVDEISCLVIFLLKGKMSTVVKFLLVSVLVVAIDEDAKHSNL